MVSVIMPCYNCFTFVEKSIQSVLSQSYKHFELIIVDDLSVDGTRDILKNYGQHPKIQLILNTTNLGTAKSRNIAINLAQGRYIAFLDSDDLWHKDKLALQVDFMIEKDLPFSYTYYEKIDAHENKIEEVRPESIMTYNKLLMGNKIGCLTVLYDSHKIGKQLMPDIRRRQDWALWLLIHKKIKSSFCLQKNLAKYTVRKGSISQNKFKLLKYNFIVYNKIIKYGKLKSVFMLIKFLFFYFFSRYKIFRF